jgi:hypothetical protein
MVESTAFALSWLAEEVAHEGAGKILVLDTLFSLVEANQPLGEEERSIAREELQRLRQLLHDVRKLRAPVLELKATPLAPLVTQAVAAVQLEGRALAVEVSEALSVMVHADFTAKVLIPLLQGLVSGAAPDAAVTVKAAPRGAQLLLTLSATGERARPLQLGARPWDAEPGQLAMLLARRIAAAQQVKMTDLGPSAFSLLFVGHESGR